MTNKQLQTIKMKVEMASNNVDNVLHNVIPDLLNKIKQQDVEIGILETHVARLERKNDVLRQAISNG